jgi:hypothetical protein
MTIGLAVRLFLDLVMAVLLLCALAYRATGAAAHEWIGAAAAVLFAAHNVLNWRWYRNIFRGRYDFRRVLNTAVNLLLLAAMATLTLSGVLLSRTVFAFLGFGGGMSIRQAHTAAAWWMLVLTAIHVGMHYEMITAAVRRMVKITGESRLRTIALRTLTALIAVYGVYASFDREMGAKLFLGYSFDYWDPGRPAVLFFSHNLVIMGVFVCAAHYFCKWLACRGRRRNGGPKD